MSSTVLSKTARFTCSAKAIYRATACVPAGGPAERKGIVLAALAVARRAGCSGGGACSA